MRGWVGLGVGHGREGNGVGYMVLGRRREREETNTVQRENQNMSTHLALVRPLIPQLIQDIQLPKRTEHVTHQPALSHRLLHAVKPLANHALCAHNPRHARRHLPQSVKRTRDSLLPARHRLRKLLRSLQTRINNRHGNHPNAMLHTRRQYRDLREQALIRRAGHDLVRVALGAAVGAGDDKSGAKVLEEVPAGAGDGEEVEGVVDVAEDVEGGVVLEEEVEFYAYAADVFEHGGELHVFGVGAEAVEAACDVMLAVG